jgi:predicted  nucleic acid-binding Zn-ribbon protein
MQVHLKAKDDLTRELVNATKRVQKLEAQLRDLGDATGPDAERDIRRLTTQLDKAYKQSRTLTGAVDGLDDKLDALGYSARAAERRTDSLGRSMDGTERKSRSMAAGWGKLIGVAAGVTGAIAAMSGAFRLLGSSLAEAREQRKAMAQTAAVMKSMGRTEAPKAIEKLVRSLSLMSGIEDDEILSSVNLMLTFGEVTGKTFNEAERAAVDLSAAFHLKLQSATVMVGKALNNPIGGLTSLMRVGVAFTEQQKEQVKSMMEVGDLAGAQAIIMAELKRQVSGSAKAQADDIDKISVAWKDVQQSIGEVLLSGISEIMQALFPAGLGAKDSPLVGFSKWLKNNRGEMVRGLVLVARGVTGLAQSFVNLSLAYGSYQAMRLRIKAWTDIGITGEQRKAMRDEADAIDERNDNLRDGTKFLQDWLDKLDASADALDWQNQQVKTLRDAIAGIKDKEVKIRIRATMKDVYQTVTAAVQAAEAAAAAAGGDTTVGMGTGTLGAGGLAAYHAAYSSALGGHSILSGVRGTGLGSVHSDHRYGRAMDIQGPRLGSYAQVVRRNGGYAAMHGHGANRHLHVVPQTRRPQSHTAGGNTYHADVVVNNPRQPMDVQAAVTRGLREAERQSRERG